MSNGYQPGHDSFVAWALEPTSTASSYGSWDTGSNPTLPSIPSSPTLCGYSTGTAKQTDTYGSKKGMAVGSYKPMYDADGAVVYEIQVQLAVSSTDLLMNCLRSPTGAGLYHLPDICLFVGQSNTNGIGYTDVYRFCKCATLQLQLQSGSAQELKATATFWALARQTGATRTPTPEQYAALGEPFFWHDVHSIDIGGGSNLRRYFQGATISVNHNLERKEIRPHLGQDNELSLVPYEIMPHGLTVDGDLTLHRQLLEDFYTSGKLSRRWGNISFGITDGPRLADAEGAKYFDLTLTNVVPQSRSKGGNEATAEVQYSTPYLADDLIITTTREEDEEEED